MNQRISNTESLPKKTHILITILLSIPVLLGLLIYGSHNLVFADSDTVEIKGDIRAMVYGTDTDLERSSRRPKLISIKKGENVYKILTVDIDIHDILRSHGITVDGGERVIINSQYMVNGSLVRVIKTEVIIEENVLDIPFNVKVIKTDKYAQGEENIVQEGVLGVRRQRILNYYEDGILVMSKIIEDSIKKEPAQKIVEIGTSMYSLNGIELRGYNCPYWYSVIDSGPYNEEEKKWLKFVMLCESGCNAESNKGYYKGLFQWSPPLWKKQYTDNIFDGHAQIKHTIFKYRAGAATMWPACNQKFNSQN
jgi:hypothetical protein